MTRVTASASTPAWLKTFRPEQVRTLDPRRHALIEASAGTGKTFAIEHLVLRLLVENPDWNLENILLLSFTDKTVAELRDRIRRLLRAQIDGSEPGKRLEGWGPQDIERLRQCWLHADDLSVHTLHAFCQAALRRDPVSNNALIRAPLTDDAPMADVALDRLLRRTWSRDPVRLKKLRHALGLGAGEGWRRKLVRLALKWQPWRFDTLDPDGDPGSVEGLEAEAAQVTSTLLSAVAALEQCAFPIAAYRRSFAFTKTGRAAAKGDENLRRHTWQKVFVFIEGIEGSGGIETSAPSLLKFFLKGFTQGSRAVKNGWESEIPEDAAGLNEWLVLANSCQALRRVAQELEQARERQRLGLMAEAARELRAALDEEKLRRGLISYEDMPRNLVEALRRTPRLAARLRSRYKACIVDEFQDTDPLQWEILQALCLEPESDAPEGVTPTLPLFLVGDPKQAIYAFRGGDLRTYMTARARLRTLASEGLAQGVALDANFRSKPALIAVMNAVFATEEWFGAAPEIPPDPAWHLPGVSDAIVFTPVRAGLLDTEGDTEGNTENDAALSSVVWLRDFAGLATEVAGKTRWPGKTLVQREVREWITSRIAEALRDGARAEDFAVLTRSNPEGEAVARQLRRRGISCRIRQRGGVWSDPGADALRLLLEWIGDAAEPDAQARILLLPFMPRTPGEARGGRPEQCPPLIARWAALADKGRWPEVFESVHHEGGYGERLALRSPEEAARFERLMTLLSEAGAAPGTTTRALCERFDALRRGEDAAPEEEGETNGDGGSVTIMTLHLSKGLEFRHVFIAATGSGRKDEFLVLRDADSQGFRIALDTSDPEQGSQAASEARAEDKRLYYVGFTRARDTLHVPLLPERFSRGESGPLGDFVATALRRVAEHSALAGSPHAGLRLGFDEAPLWNDVWDGAWNRAPGNAQDNPLNPAGISSSSGDGRVAREAAVAEAREAFDRRRRIASYSGLALRAGETTETAAEIEPLLNEAGTRAQRQEPEAESPEETRTALPVITALELPPGAGAGTALHGLLEHTLFTSARDTADPEAWLALPGQRERVEEALLRESVDPSCAPAAARAVWNALRMPLPDPAGGPAFRLADLENENDYRHEVEFLFPFPGTSKLSSATPEGEETPLPEISRRGSFLWGFIDLVFRKDGRYYLLDWKSNLLPAYDSDSIRRSMESHRYDLQWKLYSVALHRWLGVRLPAYDPDRHFGGVHYLYLRGAHPAHFSGFATRPDRLDLTERFPAELAGLMSLTDPHRGGGA